MESVFYYVGVIGACVIGVIVLYSFIHNILKILASDKNDTDTKMKEYKNDSDCNENDT